MEVKVFEVGAALLLVWVVPDGGHLVRPSNFRRRAAARRLELQGAKQSGPLSAAAAAAAAAFAAFAAVAVAAFADIAAAAAAPAAALLREGA